ncbi:MAG: flagellin B [Campylobacterales bacterium]
MAFQVNTNVNALNSHAQATFTQRNLANSLEKLSSGLRINKAADDASGMAIADSLRAQAGALGQAINNSNEAIGIIQIADKAMDEQIKILDTIKTKATQAAQDGQTSATRKAIQDDINRLMESLDGIAGQTSYNGQSLLAGSFTNKEFQVGAYSNESVRVSIGATSSDKIGNTRFETGQNITGAGTVSLTFEDIGGSQDIELESVVISTGAGTGIGVLAETINKNSDQLEGIRASWQVQATATAAVTTGTVASLAINGITIGDVTVNAENDANGELVAAINAVTDQTGVQASIDEQGHLNLTSVDGRGISGVGLTLAGFTDTVEEFGRLSLTRLDGRDIKVDGTGAGLSTGSDIAEETINLRSIKGNFTEDQASAMGFFANTALADRVEGTDQIAAGVTSLKGAMGVMSIAETAQKNLDTIRAGLGSAQNQITSTLNNITITQVNVKAAEAGIREVDFAAESATFNKLNILAQSGSYAMSQSNAVQQNILRLLQ